MSIELLRNYVTADDGHAILDPMPDGWYIILKADNVVFGEHDAAMNIEAFGCRLLLANDGREAISAYMRHLLTKKDSFDRSAIPRLRNNGCLVMPSLVMLDCAVFGGSFSPGVAIQLHT